MEYAFILLFLYTSYLSVEKYVHTGASLNGGADSVLPPVFR